MGCDISAVVGRVIDAAAALLGTEDRVVEAREHFPVAPWAPGFL